MHGNQALPDRERFWKLIGVDQLKYDSKIRGAIGWNYVVKNGAHVRVDAPATRESLRVVRLQARGGFVTGECAESSLTGCARIPNAKKCKRRREPKGKDDDGKARRGFREAQEHSNVLCLPRTGDAS